MKTYTTKSNAVRAAKSLAGKLGKEFTIGEVQKTAGRWFFEIVSVKHEVQLTPAERELLKDFAVTYPAAPDPKKPLVQRAKMKPFAEWEVSECDTPVAVAWEVYGHFHAQGRIDERKAAIAAAMEAGVQRNTAHTQYRRFRIAHGLPGAVGKTS